MLAAGEGRPHSEVRTVLNLSTCHSFQMGSLMRSRLLLSVTLLVAAMASAKAQVPLSAYVDANGFIDVQKLTCAQLAGTFQEDADALTAWYSGWYNGLAKKHFLDLRKGKLIEHEVIVYCKANPEKLIIDAIAVVLKAERELMAIQVK
ncbi:HdeA/HdeB family chaperone [Bradyrhizobium sp. BEA-2-5]|nr:HdeA/HdeB family chaperone [Bradyrhizobium sp. BEA-2-5]WOH80996.1 HdeA/HdeB family chaperone [Bradyrhizobium sp. BEA-2-5]